MKKKLMALCALASMAITAIAQNTGDWSTDYTDTPDIPDSARFLWQIAGAPNPTEQITTWDDLVLEMIEDITAAGSYDLAGSAAAAQAAAIQRANHTGTQSVATLSDPENLPIGTAAQTALDAKMDATNAALNTAIASDPAATRSVLVSAPSTKVSAFTVGDTDPPRLECVTDVGFEITLDATTLTAGQERKLVMQGTGLITFATANGATVVGMPRLYLNGLEITIYKNTATEFVIVSALNGFRVETIDYAASASIQNSYHMERIDNHLRLLAGESSRNGSQGAAWDTLGASYLDNDVAVALNFRQDENSESGDTFFDMSGGENAVDGTTGPARQRDGVLYTVGSNEELSIPVSDKLESRDNLTVMVTAKAASAATTVAKYLVWRWSTSDPSNERTWFIQNNTAGKFQVNVYGVGSGSAYKAYSYNTPLLDDQFHHLAFTWSDDDLKLYVDGAEVITDKTERDDSFSQIQAAATVGMDIGNGAASSWQGVVKDVVVIGATLTADEIAAHAAFSLSK